MPRRVIVTVSLSGQSAAVGYSCSLYFSTNMSRFLCIALLMIYATAHAQIYERVDSLTGQVTYTNSPPRGVEPEPDAALPSQRLNRPAQFSKGVIGQRRGAQLTTPATFPRIDAREQKQRDMDRRAILADELAYEEKALGRLGQKPDEQAARRHRENIASLKRELANLQ